jgi:predicted porin
LTCIKSNLVKVAKYHLLDLSQIKSSFVVFGDLRMKKLLIATAALAMVAGTAQAQSSVTVYGILDQSIGSFDTGAATANKGTANGTSLLATQRLGFKGSEDLGGGLKANFVIEGGLTNGGAQSWARATYAELAGSFGSVKLGWTDLGTTNIDDTMSQAGNLGAMMTRADAEAATNATGTLDGLGNDHGNGIVYTTPNFNGITVELGYKPSHAIAAGAASSFAETTANESLTGVRVDYVQGKLKLAAGQTKGKSEGASTSDRKLTAYGASYDFGVASVGYSFVEAEPNSTTSHEYNLLSAKVPLKNGFALHGVYQTAEANTANEEAKGYTLAVTKALSKRTTVYAAYSDLDNKGASAGYGMRGTGAPGAVNQDPNAFAVGVLHTF